MNTFLSISEKKSPIGIVGLGYVGLPLASLFASKFRVIGFDINPQRVSELSKGYDRTDEVTNRSSLVNDSLSYTCDPSQLKQCPVIIVTVPTPVDEFKKPDLSPLLSASKIVGENLSPGTLIIFESTVYPGCTETECRSVIESHSQLRLHQDFELGYSPERVNPGDKHHTIDKITKVISASSPEALQLMEDLYGSILQAGIHKVPNIKTAEAAKVIENIQRDINIALINELALIFDRCGIDTQDVLEAAGTKWNFLKFTPGLVGGHCIGVDPYYLTYMAEGLGMNSQLVLSGRRVNDAMGPFVAEKALKLMLSKKSRGTSPLQVAVVGMTFKENVPDLRNSKSLDVVRHLEDFGVNVHCVDPICDPAEFQEIYSRPLRAWADLPSCDAIIVAVKHKVFQDKVDLYEIERKLNPQSKVLLDLKGIYDRRLATSLGIDLWRL